MFGQRIAQKIWLGYAIPLAVLVVAGVLVPAALSAILGPITRDYQSYSQFVEKVGDLENAARVTSDNVDDYVRYRSSAYRRRFAKSHARYIVERQSAAAIAAGNPALQGLLREADTAYQYWLNKIAQPQLRSDGSGSAPAVQAGFTPVSAMFAHLSAVATSLRDEQEKKELAAERMRRIMTIVGPVTALLLALLIGRSISLGVTGPLETLTRATEALEHGHTTLLLEQNLGSETGDEIDDLKQAFVHMARTIGQREAVLRAQNEALGALNRRAEAVLNATNDGIIMLDRGGGFSVVNQRFADLFDLDAEILLDQTFEQAAPLFLSRFQDSAEVQTRLSELFPDPQATADETHEIIRPEHRVLRIYSAPVRGETNQLLGRIFVFRDVTRETAVDRMKTEFISVVSHELRTPLTAIKGYVDLMVGGQTGAITPLQHEFLTIVQNSTSRLGALINDMLDISRIESGRVEVRQDRVDYARLVRESAATLSHAAEAKDISLTVELPDTVPAVNGDADRITQVLMNLISNGLKYTHNGGRVSVKVEVVEDAFLITAITDTGVGISAADQRRLFQKFFRADNSSTREVGGTGLGLAITRAILEKLNGSIWVESEPGKGSSFFFTLPLARAPAPPAMPLAADRKG